MPDSMNPQEGRASSFGPVWDEAYAQGYKEASARWSDARGRHLYAYGYADGAVVATKSAVEAIERA